MVSITCLEFAYTQSPKTMKSVIMALFLMSVSLGNFFTAGVNSFIQVPDQLASATALNTAFHSKRGDNKEKLETSAEERAKLVEVAKDLNGVPIIYNMQGEGYTLTLAGEDGKQKTMDDIKLSYKADGARAGIVTPADSPLAQAFEEIKKNFEANSNTLPRTADGEALVAGFKDAWGSSLTYRLVNRNQFRLTSLGSDKAYMTPNDIVLLGSVSRPNTDPEAAKRPFNWRESMIIDLKGEAGKAEVIKSRGGVDSVSIDTRTVVGGQTNLEGATYFWFFTILMLVTAFIFVAVAFMYKPKSYLQEEAGA